MPKKTHAPLTQEFVLSLLAYDPDTGLFRWKNRPGARKNWNTLHAGQIAGTVGNKGHIVIQIGKGTNYRAHVLAWLIMTGEWRPDEIDHRDRNPANNCWSNFRLATYSENACNKSMQRNNKSGYIGVSFHALSGQWQARITKNRKCAWCGLFPTKAEAAAARRAKLTEIHGEFARH